MSVHRITVEGNSSIRLPVGGTYCDRDIIVTVEGGDAELPELTSPGTSADLLTGKQMIDGEGNIVEGTMVNNGSVRESLRPSTVPYVIPEGYHDGTGQLSIAARSVSLTPTKEEKTYGFDYYFRNITIKAIPDEYQDVTPVTATADDVAAGKVFVDATGAVVTGTAEAGGGEDIVIDPDKTYIFVNIGSSRKSPRLGFCVVGTATIDWGDGTPTETLTGTSPTTLKYTNPHTYAEAGDYVITISTDGRIRFAGTSGRSRILCAETAVSDMDYAYLCGIKKIIMGNCVDGIGTAAFYYCCSIADMVISDNVNSINSTAFSYCYYLNNVEIPPRVTTIQANTFVWCYAVTYYDFSRHSAVPKLANVSAFNGMSADCEIRVPAALYDEWIAAGNWSNFASQIVAV